MFWALLWWLGTGLAEIVHFAPPADQVAFSLLFVTGTVFGLEVLGSRWGWPLLRHFALLLLPALLLVGLACLDQGTHPLAGSLLLAVPLAFAGHYALLRRHEQAYMPAVADGSPENFADDSATDSATDSAADSVDQPIVLLPDLRHLLAGGMLIGALGWELAWQAADGLPGVTLWPLLAWGAVGLGAFWLSTSGLRRDWWPWSAAPAAYRGTGARWLVLALAGWSGVAMLTHAGGGTGLPYLPLLNPLDVLLLASLWAVFRFVRVRADARWNALLAALLLLWLSTLAARVTHHWAAVPWQAHALWHAPLLQALLTLLWTLGAISAMILAGRVGLRRLWMAGMALLGVVGGKLMLVDLSGAGTLTWTASLIGVALLLLAAGYLAPAPPKAEAAQASL